VLNTAVGQTDIAELLIQFSTDNFFETDWNDRDRPVLQIIGSLDKPQLFGIVSYGEIRTILDLRARKVFFSDQALGRFNSWNQNPDTYQSVGKSWMGKPLIRKPLSARKRVGTH